MRPEVPSLFCCSVCRTMEDMDNRRWCEVDPDYSSISLSSSTLPAQHNAGAATGIIRVCPLVMLRHWDIDNPLLCAFYFVGKCLIWGYKDRLWILHKQGSIITPLISAKIDHQATGCFYLLSPINSVWGALKCSKSNFNPVHVFLHFKSFCLVVLKLILASKLSELQQFENRAANYQLS